MNELISFVIDNLFDGLRGDIRFTRYERTQISGFRVEETENGAVFTADLNNYEYFKIYAVTDGDSVIFSIDTKHLISNYSCLQPENGINFSIGGKIKPDSIRSYYHLYTCCLQPKAYTSLEALESRTHTILARYGDVHYNVLALAGDIFRCDFDGNGFHISTGDCGYRDVCGTFLVVSRANDPFTAIDRSYEFARANGGIRVPLKRERELPDCLKGLGYCTFNTYDLDISDEKIFAKLDDYKANNVPLNWVLIDDGWQHYENRRLVGWGTDPVKFPNGLAPVVKRIKEEYGVKYVGVWHAIGVYWDGFEEGSEAFNEQRENLMKSGCGLWIPSIYEDKGFKLFDKMYADLKACGIDFVKIDSQSMYSKMVEGSIPTVVACRRMHDMIERAAVKNFGSPAVVNCMGMDIENVYARPMSVVARNSRDFGSWDDDERFLEEIHLFTIDNTLNAIWHDKMTYCDFDMWWSSHKSSAVQSAVLRAIHDGPNYVSDPGPCDPEVISCATGEHGEHYLCDHAAYPTLDCIYDTHNFFKVWNRSSDNFALAVYNVSGSDTAEAFRLSVIHGLDPSKEYLAYEYFTKTFLRVNTETVLKPEIEKDGVRVYSIYPIELKDGTEYVTHGDFNKYVSIAHENKTATPVSKLI